MSTPPPVGDVKPSNLYADAQSRALWLGVNTQVDPNGAVLIADITQTYADIAQAESRANSFTNARVASCAPAAHQHVAADVTDFNQAVDAAVADNTAIAFARGMILMWFGSPASVGVGALTGWALCDGSTYNVGGTNVVTPDLTDRFVVGSGSKPWGTKNALGFFKTADDGDHRHTNDQTSISLDQMPTHTHPITNLSTTENGDHSHTVSEYALIAGSGVGSGSGFVAQMTSRATSTDGKHTHNLNGNTGSQGSAQGHTHTMQLGGIHGHQITSQQLRDNIPYLVLAFIMKL